MVEIMEIGVGRHLILSAKKQLDNENKSATICVSKDDAEVLKRQHAAAVALYKDRIVELERKLAESELATRFAEEQAASWKKKCACLAESLEAFKQGKQVVKPACFFPQPQPGKNDTTASVEVNNFKLVVGE